MNTRAPEMYDVVGVGFGPSSLSLATALEEVRDFPESRLSAAFFERQSSFGWHRDMLLPSAKMQVSFLKDLATFRRPTSSFSFVSYLHAVGRLAQFVNNKDFFPTRREFHDYLEWAAAQVSDYVTYNTEVTGIGFVDSGPCAGRLAVRVRRAGTAARAVYAHNVIISTGLIPRMPAGIERDENVWHSSEFIGKFEYAPRSRIRRVAVAGAGQSAAEITRFLYDALPDASVFAIIPSYGYSIADDTPFANEVFDAGAVDDHYFGSARSRDAFWRYHRNTNYSVADDEVISDLYRRRYDDEVRKINRLNILKLARVTGLRRVGDRTRLSIESLRPGQPVELDVDVLVCATGYSAMEPASLLREVDEQVVRDDAGRYRVERDYRLVTTLDLPGGIYLQGGTEYTHGLASSLLSNIAVRSGEIVDSILTRRAQRELEYAVAADIIQAS
jgi:L-ornithine N5-oxygenase